MSKYTSAGDDNDHFEERLCHPKKSTWAVMKNKLVFAAGKVL